MLLLVQHIHSSIFAYCRGNAAGEVCELIQLIKILGSLEQNLLIVIKVIIWVNICVPQQITVFLQVSDLVIKIYEFLSLLLHQERSFGHVELHDSFLLLINILEISHLVSVSLHAMSSSLLESQGVV